MDSSHLARVLRLVVGLGLFFFVVLPVQPAHAVGLILTVDTLTDSAALTACTAAPNDCSLRGAIIRANTAGGADVHVIRLSQQGVYALTVAGAFEDFAATGDLDIRAVVDIRNTSGGSITIGSATAFALTDRVFDVHFDVVLYLSGVTIRGGNTTSDGGGINYVGLDLVLSQVTVSGNRSDEGGGMYVRGGRMTLTNVIIRDNEATHPGLQEGGGIKIQGGGPVVLTNVLIANNVAADRGGGILNFSGDLTLVNVTLTGNSSTIAGGGIWFWPSVGGSLTLRNVTITGNTASSGAGVFINDGTATAYNTIIANQASGANCGANSGFLTGASNLQFGDVSCGDPSFTNADPKFGPLQDNGGWTQTHALLPGSAAIDTGSLAFCPPVDQRGHTRPTDGDANSTPGCDIGAFEAGGQPHKPAVIFSNALWALDPTPFHTRATNNLAFTYGINGDIPLLCDWNGDGTRTPGVFRNGQFFLRNTLDTGGASIVFAYGLPGDTPLCGDWNGDGIETIGIWRNGAFFLRNTNSSGNADIGFPFGLGTDKPIVGDWNGDLTDSIGVFRAGGQWYLRNANSTGTPDHSLTFGLGTDTPITGDWNGDGTDSIGVVRNGTWYLRNANTTGNADTSFVFGQAGATPRVWR